ncbi:restriction endonuclease subunit S [Staphylococcus pseudintermedius]|uniref:Type I restriction-modification system S subunit n=1 Tax=Staphylococcus pseudintermedius TaxID=283734 RepID=A0A0S4I3L6_STAPS|nr:restriction endonuclease subunit S [Staphylococcus pseudintermedius]QDX54748.1 restriction endonuclease subunit S [Staphylococcus pseudintermedius]QDX61348.1 restriction endonuclease subunit S [Staphylococcus pseudintermedius]TPD27128.1 restriction endonuclease subunit S [Staphylococcus pseudintermedius]CRL92645.1 Type I restriction-modification system S subunit [Staphylococcus pseudintermedius]
MTEQTNTPELRFPEYKNEWDLKKIGNLANIVRGASPRPIKDSKWFDDNSEVGWLRISDVTQQNGKIKFLQQHLSTEGQKKTRVLHESHLLLSIAASVGKPVINYVKTGVHDGFLIFMKPKFNLYFMFNWLENFQLKWNKYGQPGSQVNLNSDLVRSQDIYIPHLYEEQEKIGNFFNKLDRQIELEEQKLEKLEEQKKGYMQKIFSQELRFKDEEDNVYPDWIRTKLINIVTPLKGQDDNITNLPILTISASRGWLNQKERFSQVIAGNSLKKYTQVKKNDLSYNKGNSKVAKYGIVFRLKNEALVPNVYKSFRPNENIDSIFIEKYFHNKTLDKQLRTRITSTARTDGLLNISDQDFYDIKLYIPILQEQTKIADFLNKLDKLIEKQSSKIILLKHRKKGLLQKMFV